MKVEFGLRKIDTKLVIVIDPPNQSPAVASQRVDEFIHKGGKGVLVGGSGAIEPDIFQNTVAGIIDVTKQYISTIPVWIFPGHLDQIPKNGDGINGLLNYKYIMGSGGRDFDQAYPPKAREYVAKTLQARNIPDISTLYILCGDPNASVSKVSGILPLDFTLPSVSERFLKDTSIWLNKGVECVYFESGSGAGQPINQDTVIQTRHLIDKLNTQVSLFVSGGVRSPAHARLFAGIADYVVVGGYFERNGVKEVPEFVAALRT